jgi:hypothetical protein
MPETREIPLSIPIFEGALAFAALWTARFLGGPVWLRPLFAGLALVSIDLMIDPIVASTYDCTGASVRKGLAGAGTSRVEMTQFYGIPLFNSSAAGSPPACCCFAGQSTGLGRDMGPGLGQAPRRMAPVDERPPMRGIVLLGWRRRDRCDSPASSRPVPTVQGCGRRPVRRKRRRSGVSRRRL